MNLAQGAAEGAAEDLVSENLRLRKAMRDMVAMATLPALWIGLDAEGIARSLASALLATLSLDLVYVRIAEPDGLGHAESLRFLFQLGEDQAKSVQREIEALLEGEDRSYVSIPDPAGRGTLRAAVTRFGVQDRRGVLFTASRHVNYPTESDRALLGVGANQTATVLQRLHAERQLEESRENLDAALQAADLGHWRMTLADGRIERNLRHDQIFGHATLARRWDYERFLEHLAPEDRAKVDAARRHAIERRTPWELETRINLADGSSRWVWVKGKVLSGQDGEPSVLTGVIADITRRKNTERELRDARARLQAALAAGAIFTWTWDIPANRMWADESLARLFGLDGTAASGGTLEPFVEAIHPDDRERVTATLRRAVETDGEYAADYRVAQRDGSVRWVAARGQVERDADGRALRMPGVLVEITERKLLENELSVRVAQLAAMDQRKDEFLATLAHELRNPLAPIRASLQILKMPRVEAEMSNRVREVMERQVNQLVRLVDDLLDVSRVMRGKIDLRREAIELSTVVARAVETVQPLIEANGHSLEVDLPSESLLLDADPVRLSQVVGNLLGNAAKYTDRGGSIRVKAARDGDQVVLRVIDDGIGIPPDMLAQVFELFVQVDQASSRSHGGLGIGLTLVRNLVAMHHGSVEVHSDGPGQGSEFRVRLPLCPSTATDDPVPDVQEPGTAHGQRVLVVDDNVDAAESLAVLLRLQGHEVRAVNDGETALAVAREFRPALVLLDVGMPKMDGHEVARRMRSDPAQNGCVIAALTGWGQQQDRVRTKASGFDVHLVKPVESADLERLLECLGTSAGTGDKRSHAAPTISP